MKVDFTELNWDWASPVGTLDVSVPVREALTEFCHSLEFDFDDGGAAFLTPDEYRFEHCELVVGVDTSSPRFDSANGNFFSSGISLESLILGEAARIRKDGDDLPFLRSVAEKLRELADKIER